MSSHGLSRSDRAGGFTYVLVLFVVAVMGMALAAVAEVWHTTARREQEKELLYIGAQFRNAIARYYERHAGTTERLPKQLEDLLGDAKQIPVQRYLRKIFVDPTNNKPEWGLVRTPAGGILGVYSLSEKTPLKSGGFPAEYAGFEQAQRYSDWKFVMALPEDPKRAQLAAARSLLVASSEAASNTASAPPHDPPAPGAKPPRVLDCDAIAARDLETCEFELKRWGNASECLTSANARQQACSANGGVPPLPPIAIRYQ